MVLVFVFSVPSATKLVLLDDVLVFWFLMLLWSVARDFSSSLWVIFFTIDLSSLVSAAVKRLPSCRALELYRRFSVVRKERTREMESSFLSKNGF